MKTTPHGVVRSLSGLAVFSNVLWATGCANAVSKVWTLMSKRMAMNLASERKVAMSGQAKATNSTQVGGTNCWADIVATL